MTYRLETLGGFRLVGPEGPVEIKGKKLRGLLAYLACEGHEMRSRSQVMSLLWGSYFEEQAQQNLRSALRRLRQLLGSASVIGEDATLSLDPERFQCDAPLFEAWAAAGEPALLRKAVELYQGDFLEGLAVGEPVWENWLRDRRQRLQSLAVESFVKIAGEAISAGRLYESLGAATQATQLDGFREDAHRMMMRALSGLGRRAEALRVYEALWERLAKELNTDPSSETMRLAKALREGKPLPMTTGPPWPAIAVLPFVNLSDGPEQALFCEGVTVDVITELSRFRDLLVTDPASSFATKGDRADLATLCKTLGVNYIVQGSLRRYGGRVRLAVQLVDAETGCQIWAERYDRTVEEIFAVQDDLVRAISATLVGWLERRGRERARQKPTSSLAAYECVIEGRHHFLRMLPAENRKARAFFEQALALDPGYAAAQAWLSEAHLGDWAGGWKPAPQESLALGHDCASKAVDLDDTDSRSHTALARASCWYRDLDRARYHFDRALALNPSDAWALASSARCFILEGDADKGLQQIKETVRLNPLGRYGYQLGIGYFARGNYTEAVRALRSVKDPIDLVYAWLAASLAHAGRPMEAVKAASDFEGAFDRRCRECGIEVTQTARIFLAERYPFQRDTDLAHFLEGLEKAGIAL